MSRENTTLPVYVDEPPWYQSTIERIGTYGRRLQSALVYSAAYLVAVGLAWSLLVTMALSLPLSPAPFVVGLVTFGVYAGDRITDVDVDEISNPTQAAFIRRHKGVLSVLSAGAYGIAVALSILGGPLALGITLLPGGFWVLYATEWLPSLSANLQRLKNILVLNSALVAGAWAVAVVFLPLAFANRPMTTTAALLFVYVFVDVFINTEIPNVPDREADAAVGVSTLPVVFGVARTRQILYVLEAALSGLLIVGLAVGLLPDPVAIATLWAMGFTIAMTVFVGRTTHYRRLTIAGEVKQLGVVVLVAVLNGVGL